MGISCCCSAEEICLEVWFKKKNVLLLQVERIDLNHSVQIAATSWNVLLPACRPLSAAHSVSKVWQYFCKILNKISLVLFLKSKHQ
jgi:hypothetical protein